MANNTSGKRKRQKLAAFDGKIVHILTAWDEVFEGEAYWSNAEYCEVELGRAEEMLQIDDWVFYKSDIASVEEIGPRPYYIWFNCREHRMHLAPEPFGLIESGRKTIELRLYDAARQAIQPGDVIRFENAEDNEEVLRVKVLALRVFKSFAELYRTLPLTECGYSEAEAGSAAPEDMYKYYTPEAEQRFGVVGIKFELM